MTGTGGEAARRGLCGVRGGTSSLSSILGLEIGDTLGRRFDEVYGLGRSSTDSRLGHCVLGVMGRNSLWFWSPGD